jgi:hypothetical protein
MIDNRPTNRCKLLFNGVEWFRKGGDKALEIAIRLREQGLPIELSVIGCTPPIKVPEFVRVYGFISKSDHGGSYSAERIICRKPFFDSPFES